MMRGCTINVELYLYYGIHCGITFACIPVGLELQKTWAGDLRACVRVRVCTRVCTRARVTDCATL